MSLPTPGDEATLPPVTAEDDATSPPPEGQSELLLRPGQVPLPHILGRYRLERLLGQGGMGAVYQAQDTQLHRKVALKIPFLQGKGADVVRARFLREAQSAALLAHPNICPVHDLGEINGVPYLTMAYIDGEPLSRQSSAGLPAREAVSLTRKIALALAEAHDRGVIHRDLKPANILIDRRGEPIVMDFGLARRADGLLGLTQEGDVMGTPAYMPPEQIAGNIQAMGPASDIYSLGIILYELLTGRLPFQGDLLALLGQITSDPPAPPSRHRPQLDTRLDALCLRALAKIPEQRYATMRDFARALDDFLAASTPAFASSPVLAATSATATGPRLSLRIPGTPLAYRPAPGQQLITLGRQKRRPGDPDDVGNDVVLRVPGNDVLSSRISRRHLEIARSGDEFVVIDRSKAGTLHNGRPLERDKPVRLGPGDRLVVAGVLTLEVDLQGTTGGATLAVGELSIRQDVSSGTVALEVSVGDMVTLE